MSMWSDRMGEGGGNNRVRAMGGVLSYSLCLDTIGVPEFEERSEGPELWLGSEEVGKQQGSVARW